MKIGDVAAATGVSVRALRYYEEQGLLHPQRTASGHRVFESGAVERVRLLQELYSAGLSSSTIVGLLPCVDAPSGEATAASVAMMQAEYGRIAHQIRELETARDHLGEILRAARAHLEDAPRR